MSSYLGRSLVPPPRPDAPAAAGRRHRTVVPVLTAAFLGTPVIATVCFFVVYAAADASPAAPSGDTGFAWMPLLYALLVLPVWGVVVILGVVALVWQPPSRAGFRAAWAVVAACVLTVLWVFVYVPGWGGPEGFPTEASVRGLAVLGVALSLVPSMVLAWWLARRAWAARDDEPA